MLSKLIKHEWRNVSKIMILINSFTVIMTVIGCIAAFSPIWQSNVEHIAVLAVSVFMLYYITILVVSFSSMIYLAVRFYKNLYTDEGYLMHTLPVTPRQLILSKGFVATCWSLITTFLILFSLFALGAAFFYNIPVDYPVMDGFQTKNLLEFTGYAVTLIEETFDIHIGAIAIWGAIYMIIGSISGIATIYGAVSLGQLFTRHKVMGAFLSYFGIYIIIQTVTSVAMTPVTTTLLLSENSGSTVAISGVLNPVLLASLVISVIAGVCLYILTEYMMTRRLNLD